LKGIFIILFIGMLALLVAAIRSAVALWGAILLLCIAAVCLSGWLPSLLGTDAENDRADETKRLSDEHFFQTNLQLLNTAVEAACAEAKRSETTDGAARPLSRDTRG